MASLSQQNQPLDLLLLGQPQQVDEGMIKASL